MISYNHAFFASYRFNLMLIIPIKFPLYDLLLVLDMLICVGLGTGQFTGRIALPPPRPCPNYYIPYSLNKKIVN